MHLSDICKWGHSTAPKPNSRKFCTFFHQLVATSHPCSEYGHFVRRLCIHLNLMSFIMCTASSSITRSSVKWTKTAGLPPVHYHLLPLITHTKEHHITVLVRSKSNHSPVAQACRALSGLRRMKEFETT